jgi:outer membrane receptor protein involved in Fe transport
VRYRQLEQEGSFDATRGVLAGDEDAELSASVTGKSLHLGLYATDTWQLAPGTHVTATLRANRSRVSNTLTTVDDDTGVLEAKPKESFTYTSLNPALGVVQQRGHGGLAVFANLARNTRVPTVIELGCADPDEPCRLPAGLQSDPYLKQVRATSLEAGPALAPAPGQRLELALFRTDNRDDIVFGSVSATSQLGYFQNFERTRHQGLDASWQAQCGPVATVGRLQPPAGHLPGPRHPAHGRAQRHHQPGHARWPACRATAPSWAPTGRWAGPERGRRHADRVVTRRAGQ